MPSPNSLYETYVDPHLERALEFVSRTLGRIPARLLAYGSAALVVAFYLTWSWVSRDGSSLRDRAIAYFCIAIIMGVGSRSIRALIDYHPVYAIEKAFYTGGLLILAGQAWLNLSIESPWVVWVFIAIFVTGTVVSLEFILRRNSDKGREMVHTRRGMVPLLPRDEANRLADRLAGEIRHHNVDREYIDLLLRDIPLFDKESEQYWVTRQHRELRQRRARNERLIVGAEADAAPEE